MTFDTRCNGKGAPRGVALECRDMGRHHRRGQNVLDQQGQRSDPAISDALARSIVVKCDRCGYPLAPWNPQSKDARERWICASPAFCWGPSKQAIQTNEDRE